ncbi:MAG: hypothetical protein M3155_01995 [Actinomycetota bacterium]|nr:hypothetical protein [Actinomycetota bacterium]
MAAAPASAAIFTVNTTADSAPPGCTGGECSLRQAIAQADGNSEDDTINFNLPAGSTITLGSTSTATVSPSTNTDKLSIVGPGASQLTIAGSASSGSHPVFNFQRGVNTLSGVTVTGGQAGGLTAAGINNRSPSTLTLDGVVVTANHNDAGMAQGAGGVLNDDTMTIRNSAITNNVVDNAASGGGGGVVSHPGNILIVNTTISGNRVNATTGFSPSTGGGLWNAPGSGTMTLDNVTVSNNSSDTDSGGLLNEGDVNLANTILAGNSGPEVDCDNASGGNTVSQGHNLIGVDGGCNVAARVGDKFGTSGSPIDAKLNPLAQNGGPTPTMALRSDSPALDGGSTEAVSDSPPPVPPQLVACRTTDQRGIVRPQLTACDIGAYEYAPGVAAATAPTCSQSGQITITVNPPQGGSAQAVHYQIDGGPEQRVPTTNNRATVTVPQGRHTLTYWAESQGGDQELHEHNLAVVVDNSPPVVGIRSDQGRVTYRRGQFASVTITAGDSNSSLTVNPSQRRRRLSTTRLGTHTIRATAVDSCGNQVTRAFTYRVVAAAQRPARRRGVPRFTG